MSESTYISNWGDKLKVEIESHSSYITVYSDAKDQELGIAMNNAHLLSLAHQIIRGLT